MLLKIRVDRNLRNLFDIVEQARGKMYLEVEKEYCINLKKEEYQKIMKQKMDAKELFCFHVYHPKDYFNLVYYHMGLNLN
ncbi:MAG: hypothetical protein PHT76_05610 [Anaerostipes sp.]|nr:hypothetical protein [Anaerostipes sp.]